MLQALKIQAGETLRLSSGDYFIESEIGKGGFGSVYKAARDNRHYAIKINRIWELLPEDRDEIRKRIRQEFEISNSIQSSHIVHAFSLDEVNENPVLVMEYCPDGNLREKIGKSYKADEINNLALQILHGISSLHFFNIVHRDIKPENILFNKNLALLTDFGISANLKSRLTRTDIRGHALKVFATISYSPPEQSQKSQAFKLTGPATDIFSFGVIMYELLTLGNLPFGNLEDFEEDSKIVEDKKVNGQWDLDKLVNFTGTNYWFKIIQRCLYPDPRVRFQSTDEILNILNTNSSQDTLLAQMVWKIQVIAGIDTGKEYNLTNLMKFKHKRIVTIGRHDDKDPFVNDIGVREDTGKTYISSRHGTFEYLVTDDKPQWYLRDGQWYTTGDIAGWHPSRNGIFVNDIKIDKNGILLNNNDVIKIGNSLLRFYCE
jgi:serine/threonine protein kinase